MADEATPLTSKATVIVNDENYPPIFYNSCREFVGGIFVVLILFPLLLVLCIIISPLLIYWIIQILCMFDPYGIKNGQKSGYAPRSDDELDRTDDIHVGAMKILFIIPDGGYCPAEVSIMYDTLMSYKKDDTDEIEIIFATPSGAIDNMNILDSESQKIEVFAYGCDPLFRKKRLAFGLFNVPFVNTLYYKMMQSVDWYNSHYKANRSNSFKQIISYDEIETDNLTEMYDGVYIAGGHHWNFNHLFKNRVLHYKLSKLWQLSLESGSGMHDPIQFAAIGRGVAVLGYSLYTHSLGLDDHDYQENVAMRKDVSLHSNSSDVGAGDVKDNDNDNDNDDDDDEIPDEAKLMQQASLYNSETDSDDEYPSMLPRTSDLVPPNSPRASKRASKRASSKEKYRKRTSQKRRSTKKIVKKGKKSILYHVNVTTLPGWCEFLGNLIGISQYGQIFSASNPHMKSCGEIVENAVGDTDRSIKMMQEKKFYHKGPQNWLSWFFQSVYGYGTTGDYRLTYVVEDSHIVTGRWFIDAQLVGKRFMSKMAKG